MIIVLPTALSEHQASMLDGTRWAYMPHSRYTVLSTGHLTQAFMFVLNIALCCIASAGAVLVTKV